MTDVQSLEQSLERAEDSYGPDSVEVAKCLEQYAKFLREKKMRTLDAANMEARARVIRSKQTPSAIPDPAVSKDEHQTTRRCPYCAETIRAEAVTCRFCNRDLKRMEGKKYPVLFIAVCAIPLLGLWIEASILTNQIRNHTVTVGSVTGAAWVRSVDGSSEIQRGQEIALCDSGLDTDQIDSIVDHYKRYFVEDWPIKLGVSAKLVSKVTNAIAPHVVQTTRTDVDGKYNLRSVPVGSYYLFSQLSTGTGYVCWILPLTISESQSVSVDLDNSNANQIINTQREIGPHRAILLLRELEQEY